MLARTAFAASAALALAWAVVSLWWPMGFDLGLYAWVGDVVVRGGMQYRDAWDMHGPLVAYLLAIPEWLFGRQVWGIRLLDLAMLAVGAAGVHRVVRTEAGAPAARWAVVALVLAYGSLSFNETAQPDGWVGLVGLAALAPLLVAGRAPTRSLALAGATIGCLTAVKPFYLLFLAAPAAWLLLARPASEWRATVRAALVLGATFLLPLAAITVWFALRGALDALVEVHLLYTTQVYSGTGSLRLGERVSGVVEFVWRGKIVPVALAAIVVGALALWRGGRRPAAAALVTWALVAVGCVALQNKWYYYHWLPLLPALVVLGAIGLARAIGEATSGAGRALALATAAVVLAHAALRPAAYVAEWSAFATGRWSADEYYGRFAVESIRPLHQMQAARHLRARLAPGEGIAVWGADAGLHYLVGRPTPFRLAGWLWPMVEGAGTETRERYRAEYLRSLATTPPAYVVVNTIYAAEGMPADVAAFPELAAHLAARYRLEAEFGALRLYRRSATAPAAADAGR